MERAFLGIGGKGSAVKEEAGFLGSSAVNWPFSNKILAMQQFMNIKSTQEERLKRITFDHLSSSGLQPMSTVGVFDAVHRPPSMLVSQKYLSIDRQGIQKFQQPSYRTLGAEPFRASTAHHSNDLRMFSALTHHSIPIAASCPFFKVDGSANGSSPGVTSFKQQPLFVGGSTSTVPGGCSMTAAFKSGNTAKPSGTAAQLTIFYGGMVSVYDDVPLEKIQAIMSLAANGSNMNSNVESVAQIPVATPSKISDDEAVSMDQTKNMNQVQTQKNVVQPCTNLCTPISTTPHGVAQSGSGLSSTDDLTGTKAAGPLVPTSHHEPPKVIATACRSAAGANFITRAIPQARKASLARFLEKRKERVTIAAPYPPPQKSPDCISGSGFDGRSMTAETAHSSNIGESWRLSAHKNSSNGPNSPSTKLEI